MKVLLLPLLCLLLCGEALSSDDFLNSRPDSRPIVYVLPSSPGFHERAMATRQVMLNREIAGQSMPAIAFRGQRPTTPTNVGSPRIIQGTSFATIPTLTHARQGSHRDDDASRFIENKRPSNFDLDRRLTGSNQVHTPTSIGPNQRPSLITQDPKISSFNFVPKTSTFNQGHRLSGFDEVPKTSTFNETPKVSSFAGQNPSLFFTQTPKPSTFNEERRPSSFAGGQNPSSVFNQTPKPSIFARQNPPSVFDQTPRPSRFDQDDKPSTFDHIPKVPIGFIPVQKPSSFDTNLNTSPIPFVPKPSSSEKGQKPFSSDEDRKPSSFDQDRRPLFPPQVTQRPLFPPQVTQPSRNPVCNTRPDPGTCRAAIPRYYYDHQTGTCNCFLYGGCREGGQGESASSFLTLSECQRECRPPRHEEGPACKEIFKEEQFISYLVVDTPTPPRSKGVDLSHLSNKEFVASFSK